MDVILAQKCNDCGKEFQEWSCDYCYAKFMIKKMDGYQCKN